MATTFAAPRRAVTYSSFPLNVVSPQRETFSLPLRRNSIRDTMPSRRTSRSGSNSDSMEDLFTHPSARVISFEAIPSETQIADKDTPVLSWSTKSERTLAQGPLRIYRIKLQCAFLQCGSAVHPLLPKSTAWCIDETLLIFILKIRLNNYWRVEVAKVESSPFDLVNFKGVLRSLIVFENTPCPFRVEKEAKVYEEPAPLLVFKRRGTISKSTYHLKPLAENRESDKIVESCEDRTTLVPTSTEPSSRSSTLRRTSAAEDKSTLVELGPLLFTPIKKVEVLEPSHMRLPDSPVSSRPSSLYEYMLSDCEAADVNLPGSPTSACFEDCDIEPTTEDHIVSSPTTAEFMVTAEHTNAQELESTVNISSLEEPQKSMPEAIVESHSSISCSNPSHPVLLIAPSVPAPAVTTTSTTFQHKEEASNRVPPQPLNLTFADIATGRVNKDVITRPPGIRVPELPHTTRVVKAENIDENQSSSTDISIDFGTFDKEIMWSPAMTPSQLNSINWSGSTTPASPRTVLPLPTGDRPLKKYHHRSLSAAFGKMPVRPRSVTISTENSGEEGKKRASVSVRARRASRAVLDTAFVKPTSYVTQAVVSVVSKVARRSSVYNHYFPATPRDVAVIGQEIDEEDDFGVKINNSKKESTPKKTRGMSIIGEFRSRKSA